MPIASLNHFVIRNPTPTTILPFYGLRTRCEEETCPRIPMLVHKEYSRHQVLGRVV